MVKKNLSIIAVIIVSIIAVLDLSNYGIPPTHDGEYHVIRFQQFYKVLSEGVLYPRWSPDFNNGFGIPLFNYVYPLPNYMAAIFHALGFGFIDSFKLNMATATIAGAIFMRDCFFCFLHFFAIPFLRHLRERFGWRGMEFRFGSGPFLVISQFS